MAAAMAVVAGGTTARADFLLRPKPEPQAATESAAAFKTRIDRGGFADRRGCVG
jgi:hypothetical protein